jgi:predicted glycoside hydrolase/deacetylase ChbG (UPF0249 family)
MQIILSADDFGYSDHTVDRTIACFEAGALTSASIMANMPATDRAVEWAKSHPEFSYGVHLCYATTHFERPLLSAESIPALVNDKGHFLGSNTMRMLGLFNRLPVDQIASETEAQIGRLCDYGVPLSYVDSHGHLHKFAPFRQALEQVLPRFGIRCVRRVQNVYLRKPLRSPTFWFGSSWGRSIARNFTTTDTFYMPASAGDDDWAAPALTLLAAAGGIAEVGVHPGLDEEWRALDDRGVREFAAVSLAANHQLVGWRDLGEG